MLQTSCSWKNWIPWAQCKFAPQTCTQQFAHFQRCCWTGNLHKWPLLEGPMLASLLCWRWASQIEKMFESGMVWMIVVDSYDFVGENHLRSVDAIIRMLALWTWNIHSTCFQVRSFELYTLPKHQTGRNWWTWHFQENVLDIFSDEALPKSYQSNLIFQAHF